MFQCDVFSLVILGIFSAPFSRPEKQKYPELLHFICAETHLLCFVTRVQRVCKAIYEKPEIKTSEKAELICLLLRFISLLC